VETLQYLHAHEPGNDWFLILGMDSVQDLESWREPQGIASLCKLMIIQRPGIISRTPPEYFHFIMIESPLIEISSTEIRQRVMQYKTIRYLVPEAVRQYIISEKMYLATHESIST
jgi:nicotinate-nucleotide adenylyltransferase